ncbi:MAG: hypothetical protein M1419_09095 [Bacteroidetes bacterium]|nr:hypothetical protein [Bacteroidota bacterium]
MHTFKINTVVSSDTLKLNNLGFLKGREVEVTIRPLIEKRQAHLKNRNLKGFLSKYANRELITNEQEAWKQSVMDKYDN